MATKAKAVQLVTPEVVTEAVEPTDTFLDRLIEEERALSEKVTGLATYKETKGFYALPREQQDLMQYQLSPMVQYLDILRKHLQLLKPME